MAELAADGGCLTVNVRSVFALSSALERLATDEALYRRLCEEAQSRQLRGWAEFATEVGDALHSICAPQDARTSATEFALDVRARSYLEVALPFRV